ncbi:hypothetical protein H4R35_000535 [Dimargaris xerosporica]|nr:hypothetical protein H4R35_000535 [Dimargaris xerosporica]
MALSTYAQAGSESDPVHEPSVGLWPMTPTHPALIVSDEQQVQRLLATLPSFDPAVVHPAWYGTWFKVQQARNTDPLRAKL